MRLTTDFWVTALIRRIFADGGFAAVERRGAAEAGAVFILVRDRTGGLKLFSPAPQTDYDEGKPVERVFRETSPTGDELALHEKLEKEVRFDTDIWIVEIEPAVSDLSDYFCVMTP